MIREDEAAKVYGRNTPVIRKGDPGWKSDNHHEGRRGESYGTNPLSLMDQKIRQRQSREVDYALLPSPSGHELGDVVSIPMDNGRDTMSFRLVNDDRLRWKYCYITKNAAL